MDHYAPSSSVVEQELLRVQQCPPNVLERLPPRVCLLAQVIERRLQLPRSWGSAQERQPQLLEHPPVVRLLATQPGDRPAVVPQTVVDEVAVQQVQDLGDVRFVVPLALAGAGPTR